MTDLLDDDTILEFGYWCDVEMTYFTTQEDSHFGYPCTYDDIGGVKPHTLSLVAIVVVPKSDDD